MIISYIQKKQIHHERVTTLLSDSSAVNQFTNDGPVKKKLEVFLHSLLKIDENKKVVCVSNGTAACHALMYHYEKSANRRLKWVVPSFTFPTPVVSNAFSTRVVDISPSTYTVDINERLVSNSDGVILTNLFGTVTPIEEWVELCRKSNKILIFDNASSPMTSYKDSNICNFGNSSFGSLHHTKFLGFGEGGFIVVPCEEYDEINRILNFGFTSQRIHNSLSSNFKMSDVTAAYCLAHAESYDVKRHLAIQNILLSEMKKLGVSVFNTDNKMCSYALGNLPLIFSEKIDTMRFRDLGVEANKYYRPLRSFKNSNQLFSRIVNLPLHAGLTDYQIDLMCKVVCEVKKSV